PVTLQTTPSTSTVPTATVDLDRTGGMLTVGTDRYRLEVRDNPAQFERSPYARLRDPQGGKWTDINLLSSVHTTQSPDEIWKVDGLTAERQDDSTVVLTAALHSTAWTRHETRMVCTPEGVEIDVTVHGTGTLTDVTLFGGQASMSSGACGTFRSKIRFSSVLVPAAGEPVQLVRPATASAVLGVVGDSDPGRLNAIFSPPPLAFGFGREAPAGPTDVPGGDWLALWLRAPVEELSFTAMRYSALENGYLVQLDYEGHTEVDGEWRSPTLVLRPVDTAWGALEDYRADLVERGFAPPEGPEVHRWWLEPIFCGWGAQCARAVHALHSGPTDSTADTAPETPDEEPLVVRAAPSFARADVYDEFLARLEQYDLNPGTIVIDDRWQAEYGSATVNTESWPDLRCWIDARHAEGRKVLLWWKAWDPEGIPAEECVLDAAGRPITVDPGSAAYLERLRSIVTHLLSTDGLDADGLKIDFTQRGPSGRTLKSARPGVWGMAALHKLLRTIEATAHKAKPDALVICHTMHPSFADVLDMVRLNDVSKRDVTGARVPVVDQMSFRHEIARRMLPQHPIDTDQWPMPNRAEWLRYLDAQISKGVPALYYLEAIDRSGERVHPEDLERVAATWREYRESLA
ncbi:MAG: hypothetical protein M3116_04475, partial [Actinomycetota bacterium]|nr:hypothetical protein [Actinomycetota bacterium]